MPSTSTQRRDLQPIELLSSVRVEGTPIAFSHDISMCLVKFAAALELRDVRTGELRTLVAMEMSGVGPAALGRDGSMVAWTGKNRRMVNLWSASTGQVRQTLDQHADDITHVAISSDGSIVASGSEDQTVKLWDVATGRLLRTLEGHTNLVDHLAFSPDGVLVASGGGGRDKPDKRVLLWEVATGTLLRTYTGSSTTYFIAFTPNGSILASSHYSELFLWDAGTETLLRKLGHEEGVACFAFHPDGSLLASRRGMILTLWDVATGERLQTAPLQAVVNCIAFSPDGSVLAVGGPGSVELWGFGAPASGNTVPNGVRSLTNSIKMKLLRIPAGEFLMGSSESPEALAEAFGFPPAYAKYFKNEQPQHRVKITKPFYLGAHEVTVGQFRRFVKDTDYKTDAEKDGRGGFGFNEEKGKVIRLDPKYSWRNPGFAQDDDHPVVNVSWNDAVVFCQWLSHKEGKQYRLPTEAEWEYACRAGTTTRYDNGNDPEGLVRVGNVVDSTAKLRFSGPVRRVAGSDGYAFTAPVGRFQANGFGLYDMHGNVSEWCADSFDAEYYSKSPEVDPKGPSSAGSRVLRNGSWGDGANISRSANRNWGTPTFRTNCWGFRVARTP